MPQLYLKISKNGPVSGANLLSCTGFAALAGVIYGIITLLLGEEGVWESFIIGCYLICGVFIVLLLNSFFLKSPLLFNLIVGLTSPMSIAPLFSSMACAFALGLLNDNTVLLYIAALIIYFYSEIMEAKYMSMNVYIKKLRVDNLIEIDENNNIGIEFTPPMFYLKYFDGLKFPLSRQRLLINVIAAVGLVIAIPFGQKEVYASPGGSTATGAFIFVIVGFCMGLLGQHNFSNMGMIYRLKKAIKRGDITLGDFG